MTTHTHSFCMASLAGTLLLAAACAGGVGAGGSGGAPGSGGAALGTGGSTPGSGGSTTPGTGGATPGSGGATPGTGGSTPGSGGATTPGSGGRGSGGMSGSGGRAAGGGAGTVPGTGGAGGATPATPLDCGPLGWAVENHGPPGNRVNYAILGDGYTNADLAAGGVFERHINAAMAKRFTPVIGQVYGRYRNFINICAVKVVSTGAICGNSALGCCGDDTSRLATCNMTMVNAAFSTNVPAAFMMDWRAVMLNGSNWWNTGAATMLWSGGHQDAGGAALHEGGHGFHARADEYCSAGTGATCGTVNGSSDGSDASAADSGQVNMTNKGTTAGTKWPLWMGYDQTGATGVQGTYSMGAGPYRPSVNSMMNSLFGTNVNTSFNSVSREKMVMDIWQRCVPIDSTAPPAGAVSGATTLKVNVIDPAVIDVDWSVDGTVVAAKGGVAFDVAARGLTSGSHMISAKAYDNAGPDLVRQVPQTVFGRQNWARSVQTVTWTVTIP